MVAAYLLAGAAFEAGRHCQAFPAFGAERRGAPVVSFVRISETPIRRRSEVREPAFLIIQDQTLLNDPKLAAGLRPGGGVIVNTGATSEAMSEHYGLNVVTLRGNTLSTEALGRPVPNVALLSAFLALTNLLPMDALKKALAGRFKGDVLEKNLALVDNAASHVVEGQWKEMADAAGA